MTTGAPISSNRFCNERQLPLTCGAATDLTGSFAFQAWNGGIPVCRCGEAGDMDGCDSYPSAGRAWDVADRIGRDTLGKSRPLVGFLSRPVQIPAEASPSTSPERSMPIMRIVAGEPFASADDTHGVLEKTATESEHAPM